MSVGICIMAHGRLERAAELARSLVVQGCRVAIHVDARTSDDAYAKMQATLAEFDEILYAPRRACAWGGFSLVEASQEAAAALLARYDDVSHVCLISGTCLPLRPVRELQAFLIANAGIDFIESWDLEDDDWVKDGLSLERFTLHFPFNWRRQRWLFDRFVTLQRRLGVRRRMPEGLRPHIGSQWWCLSRKTLLAILEDPKRPIYERYFRTTWIPDESYFATLARKHAERIVPRSLTFAKFDPQGRPHVFYDDHRPLLEQSDCFFARKIWRGADGLYNRYLDPERRDIRGLRFAPRRLEDTFARAHERRSKGRPGLAMQSRFACRAHAPQQETAAPYAVFSGFDFVFPDFKAWLAGHGATRAHGRIFDRRAVDFAGDVPMLEGALPSVPAIRDWNPEQFLTNLIWNAQDTHQSFLLAVADSPRMAGFVRRDPNATLHIVTGAWLLGLIQPLGEEDAAFAKRVKRLAELEATYLDDLAEEDSAAVVHRTTLGDLLADPYAVLSEIRALYGEAGTARGAPIALPPFAEMAELRPTLARLARLGLTIETIGALPDRLGARDEADEAARKRA
ncbi:MAG: beta-1,6-N-acetylglucosaminyltransferase [Pseudomonadota bacterium]